MTETLVNPIISSAFKRALKKILKPLIKLLLRKGITYISLLEALKQIYIEVAEESFKLDNKRLTDSRISLLTGIHRKEVKRLRENLQDEISEPEIKAGISAAIIALWQGSADYTDKQQKPLALPRNGDAPSFESLVYSISKDKHFRSVLDDWLHQGIVRLDNKNNVCLSAESFVPDENEDEKMFFAGRNIHYHLEVINHNLQPRGFMEMENLDPQSAAKIAPMFDRSVYYKHLSDKSVHILEQKAKENALNSLLEINQLASQLQQKDQHSERANSAIHFGSYIFRKLNTDSKEESVKK
ncbi:hypothetical protein THMIRHAS_10280 [Thiosulfatimonas sediminis]|uniref:Uncharacterized protein n=1 Tax=Thiosulfatimonas sediminis TaxID=2675054 RepID=A0A6F8PU58_9GAMM|nr:DUF6502 family protein [Thiosulfatimonas sediminis]BBP45655.1 hypothetical protein THMIRHAS_10280 [Thiosulfatimonas sediminis]